MDEREQIVKIADILLESSRQNSRDKSNNKAYTVFDADTVFKYGCDRLNGATAIYNEGYRLQSEVAAQIISEIHTAYKNSESCSILGAEIIALICRIKEKYDVPDTNVGHKAQEDNRS